MLSNKLAKIFIIIGASLIALIFAVWQILLINKWITNDVIADGVSINGYDIGGYDIVTASQMLDTYFKDELNNESIEIMYDEISSSIITGKFTIYDYKTALDEANLIARTGNSIDDYITLLKTHFFGEALSCEISFDDNALNTELNNLVDYYFIQAQDAYITSFDPNAQTGEKLTITSQVKGQILDVFKTAESIKSAISAGKGTALAYTEKTDANITDEIILELDSIPIKSEYVLTDISPENEEAIYQVVRSGRYEILLPNQELSIIKFMGAEDYIYFEMPDGGTGSDYEKALTQFYPTQIYLASTMSELEVTTRRMYELYAKSLPAGTSSIINLYYDMKIRNPMNYPVILFVSYKKQGSSGKICCEVYRTSLESKPLIRSVIKSEENKTLVDITRVYVDNIGNTVDSIVVDTIEVSND